MFKVMSTFWIVIGIICLSFQVIVLVSCILHKYYRKKDESYNQQYIKEMKKMYSTYPNIPCEKPHYTISPLSMWNE